MSGSNSRSEIEVKVNNMVHSCRYEELGLLSAAKAIALKFVAKKVPVRRICLHVCNHGTYLDNVVKAVAWLLI